MTSRELFELASLDVMGLLDDQERAAFEEAFRAAPPHIQAQIRAEQLRFADDSLLPEADAPAGLRGKVLAAVRDAIAAVHTEPIARIGTGSRLVSSAAIWRAACIGFATASLVLAGFALHVSQLNRSIQDQALSNAVNDEIRASAGPGFAPFLARSTVRHVAFTPAAADYSGKAAAALLVDSENRSAYLVCNALPIEGGTYKLVLEDAQGKQTTIKEFQASAGSFFIPLKDVPVESIRQMQIQSPAQDGSRHETFLAARGV
ncbi:MAG: hypothetical protein SFZ24_05730 [Planctomycetota bacterium]|nr:hypothetical protein [Planctomycetota bacterium]